MGLGPIFFGDPDLVLARCSWDPKRDRRNGAPNCSSHHPDLHIGFDGSRTNSLAVATQNAIAEIGRGCLNRPLLGHNSPKNQYF